MRSLVFVLGSVFVVACGPPGTGVDAGVPELICDSDAVEVTLAGKVQAEVFDKPCKSCHNAQDASRGDFSEASRTAAATVNVDTVAYAPLKRVVPNDLTKSVLWLKVNGRRGPAGERIGGEMPPTGPLTDAQKKILKDWICTGAK